jgi:cytochrome c oxidase assembly protein subunit 15
MASGNQPNRVGLFASISLVCMFLIVLAGSFVRITGSGMGCPDWPKCFGYYIPPTDVNTVQLEEGRFYSKGQMVIHNDTLWITEHDFQFHSNFWDTNFGSEAALKVYPKHQYAEFNAFHTWTEYINRLLTAVFGIPVLILLILSFRYSRQQKNYTTLIWSSVTLLLIMFEAWLGKLVVDKNLAGSQITLHMVGTLGIIFSLIFIIVHTSKKKLTVPTIKSYSRTLWLILFFVIFQILLGTQVRELVDVAFDNEIPRNLWLNFLLENQNPAFKIHRSFSWFILIATVFLFLQYRRANQSVNSSKIIFSLVGTEIFIGVILSNFNFNISLQPIHLLLSICLSAAILFDILMRSKK